jgi:glutaconate CoA-transferase subunit A
MQNKVVSLKEAVGRCLHDGDAVFVGGFGQCIPFATAHEIVRQRKTGLTLCRSGADILFDLLIAAGAVRKVVFGYLGNPGIGLAHAFRRAVVSGSLEVEDWTNFAMVLRLHAGALGVPFLPTATLVGGGIPEAVGVRSVVCPYSGETLSAVPALNPDVAIVHAQRADAEGNVQIDGLTGDTVEGALASTRIIVTVEEIVPSRRIRAAPDRTVIPAFRVDAVCEVPWGAYPSYVEGCYGRDDAAYTDWDTLSRNPEQLERWIEATIRGVPDFAGFIETIGEDRLAALRSAGDPRSAHAGVV